MINEDGVPSLNESDFDTLLRSPLCEACDELAWQYRIRRTTTFEDGTEDRYMYHLCLPCAKALAMAPLR